MKSCKQVAGIQLAPSLRIVALPPPGRFNSARASCCGIRGRLPSCRLEEHHYMFISSSHLAARGQLLLLLLAAKERAKLAFERGLVLLLRANHLVDGACRRIVKVHRATGVRRGSDTGL